MSDLAKKVFELFGAAENRTRAGSSGDSPRSAVRLPQRTISSSSAPPHKSEQTPTAWPCRYCGELLTIEDVCRSRDGQRWLTIWHCSRCEVHGVTPHTLQPPPWIPEGELNQLSIPLNDEPGQRDFLPRPLGQEENPDVWDAWVPLFDWLIDHAPEHFHAVCEAEEHIRELERAGTTEGPEYQAACQELLRRFDAARRLKLKAGVKVWLQ